MHIGAPSASRSRCQCTTLSPSPISSARATPGPADSMRASSVAVAGLEVPPAHLLGVAREPHLDVDLGARHERAAAGHPLEQALGDERVERLPHGHPGHPEVLHELALGRGRAAGFGPGDQAPDVLTDLHVLVHHWSRAAWRDHVTHRTSLRPPGHHSLFAGRHELTKSSSRQPAEPSSATSSSRRASIRVIRSSTASRSGSRISSTTRPSARNTTRSVNAGRDRVVGHHHDGLPELVDGAAQQREHLGAGAGVEVAGGLVGEDDRRPAGQRPGHRDPLLLTAGELVGPVVEPVAEADRLDDRGVPLRVGPPAGDRQRQQDVLLGGQRRHQVERLEDEADLVAAQPGQLLVLEPAELGLARRTTCRWWRCPGRRSSASASTCRTPRAPSRR